jgi:hypothetical protein
MTTHKRHPQHRYMSLCGEGYDWPSTIALRDDDEDVTCKRCLARMEKEAY